MRGESGEPEHIPRRQIGEARWQSLLERALPRSLILIARPLPATTIERADGETRASFGLRFQPEISQPGPGAFDFIEICVEFNARAFDQRDRAYGRPPLFRKLDEILQILAQVARGLDVAGVTHLVAA